MKPIKFKSIITHEKPHMDEITAVWLLRTFGESKFPGVAKAKISFWSSGGKTPDGRTAAEYEQEGTLLIGVGGGRFDEHPTANSDRKENECATTLIAKTLGVDDDPALEKILNFVAHNDLKGSAQPFDLPSLVKLLHQQHPTSSKKVMDWALDAIEAKYQEQEQFWTSTKEQFEKIAQSEEVTGPNDQKLVMVSIESDDELMNKFARSPQGGQAAVIIQKRSSGNVQIFTNKRYGLTLYDVAQMIRIAEQRAKGGTVQTTDQKALSSEGVVKGCEEWFFHHALQMLMNGSSTATDVQPTRLTLEQIRQIVRIGINPKSFEPKRATECESGTCTSAQSNRCPWECYGLQRCRKVRFEMSQRQKQLS
jgi:DNA gyrase/topoisomerase IV subunit A